MSLEVATYEMDSKVTLGEGAVDEQQVITLTGATGGNYTLSFDGETTAAIAHNATGATVQTRLEALTNIEPGDVTVTGGAGGPHTVVFGGQYADQDVPAITCNNTSLTGTDEQQTITVDATAGNFTLTFGGQTTINTAFNAAANTVRDNLRNLSTIDDASLTVSGGPGAAGGGTPYTITFTGAHGSQNVAQLTANNVSLTGGAATVTPATTVPGVAPTIVPTTPTAGVSGDDAVTIPDNSNADGRNYVSGHNTTGDTPEDVFAAD